MKQNRIGWGKSKIDKIRRMFSRFVHFLNFQQANRQTTKNSKQQCIKYTMNDLPMNTNMINPPETNFQNSKLDFVERTKDFKHIEYKKARKINQKVIKHIKQCTIKILQMEQNRINSMKAFPCDEFYSK